MLMALTLRDLTFIQGMGELLPGRMGLVAGRLHNLLSRLRKNKVVAAEGMLRPRYPSGLKPPPTPASPPGP